MREFKVALWQERGGPDDPTVGKLPPELMKVMRDAETGYWEVEPGGLLIEFGHPIESESGRRFDTQVGFACLDKGWDPLIEGETILFNGLVVRVEKVDDELSEHDEGGTYTYSSVTISVPS